MVKTIWLSIVGWLRKFVSRNTDIGLAGKEHIRNTQKKIEDLRAERNRIAGNGIGLERKRDELIKGVAEAKAAVQKWHSVGDESRKQRAYNDYVQRQKDLNTTLEQYTLVENQVMDLDAAIRQLETDSDAAEISIDRAASQQKYARAAEKVEDLHDLLTTNNPLSDAIKESENMGNIAEARRRTRVQNDNSDLYTDVSVDSLDAILGETKVAQRTVHDETVRPALSAPEQPTFRTGGYTEDRREPVPAHHSSHHNDSRDNDTSPSYDSSPSSND